VDTLTLRTKEKGIVLSVKGPPLPTAIEKNAAGAVIRAMIDGEGLQGGVSASLRKGVPVGVGLGSSAASSAAAASGMDRLFRLGLPNERLVRYAGEGEKAASGTAHYDNVCASLLGGLGVVTGRGSFLSLEAPPSLSLILATPRVDLPERKTEFARSLLPKEVPLKEMVTAVGSASLMIHGVLTRDIREVGQAMTNGYVDGRRSAMIPGFERARRAAMGSGAAGVCVSGAGPTLLAACRKRESGKVARAMVKAFKDEGVKSEALVTRAGKGCRVVEET
jgi:homoserine kinase